MPDIETFQYNRPSIGLKLDCTATPKLLIDSVIRWQLDAIGECQGQPIEYGICWLDSAEAVKHMVETDSDQFYLALLSDETMQQYEVDCFAGLPECAPE